MSPPFTIVVLTIDAQRYGVFLSVVERVIHLVDYHPLPRAPEVIAGVINFEGAVLPVVGLRRRFHLPEREPGLNDHLMLVRTPRRRVALLVDQVHGLETVSSSDWVPAQHIVPCAGEVAGAVKREDGLILIHDLDACLSLDEEQALDLALAGAVAP